MRALQHPAARVAVALLALAAGGLGLVYVAARVLLAPLPGEWAVPLRWGPVTLEAGVPTLARLATAPWLAPLLHERTLATRAGPVQLRWLAERRTLALHCAPCTLRTPALGSEPLSLPEVVFTLQRQGEQVSGHISSGKVRASWRASLQKEKGEEDGMRLRLQLPMTPMADVYALAGAAVPELAQARIEGEMALGGTLSLPGGELRMTPPQVRAFKVSGLGTEKFINPRASCSPVVSRLNSESWLAHAVVAAEDPRFYQRSGYDLAELGTALTRPSQPPDQAAHAPDTLPRLLLKLMRAGDEGAAMHPLRELLYTVEMESTLGKERILQLYLAQAPWGPGICGAEAASRHYLGVRADVLTASQAAWLAAMLHDPALEVEQWASSGQINVARTQSVLQGMRTLPRQQRQRLAEDVAKVRWKAPRTPPR